MRRPWLPPSLAFLLGVFAHVESLSLWFTASDTLPLIETSRIQSLNDLWIILTKPMLYGTTFVGGGLFYRPVANITYALDYWLWGLNPFGYHLTNLLLHGLAAALVVVTVRSLTESSRAGALAGLLFAVHPLSVDVVPALARRHDILMTVFGLLALWLFVEGLRRSDRRLWYGAAGAYALALLSKEIVVLVGPLMFLWALFREPSLTTPRSYVRAFRSVVPMATVAMLYLAVRVAVLGGIGGYTGSPPMSKTALIPFEYVLALVYPAHSLGVLRDASLPLAVILGIAVPAAYLALLKRDTNLRAFGPLRGALAIVAVGGFAAVTAMLAYPDVLSEVSIPHVRHAGWYVIGVTFAVAATCAVAAALVGDRELVTRRVDLFFLSWLVLALPLYVIGGQFKFWSGYFFVIPVVALLSTYLIRFWPVVAERDVRFVGDANAALALALVVLLLPVMAASPLLYTDSGWEAVGNTSKQTLTGIDERAASTDGSTPIVVDGIATSIKHNPKQLGQARELMILQPYTIRSWMRLQGQGNPVTMQRMWFFYQAPTDVTTNAEWTEDGKLVVRVRYQW